jgi:hypothetical protein
MEAPLGGPALALARKKTECRIASSPRFRTTEGGGLMIRVYSEHAANERTFLAWARTSVAVIALGFVGPADLLQLVR